MIAGGEAVKMGLMMASVLVGIAACSSHTGTAEPFTCSINGLTGAWRVHYELQDGTCGALPDTLVILPSTTAQDAGAQCTYGANVVSQDHCTLDSDFTCPLASPYSGTQRWTWHARQISDTGLNGTATVMINGNLGPCQSTYGMTISKEP